MRIKEQETRLKLQEHDDDDDDDGDVSCLYSNLINLKFIVPSPAKGHFRSEIRLCNSCFTSFCFKPSCKYAPLLNLHPLTFGVNASG